MMTEKMELPEVMNQFLTRKMSHTLVDFPFFQLLRWPSMPGMKTMLSKVQLFSLTSKSSAGCHAVRKKKEVK